MAGTVQAGAAVVTAVAEIVGVSPTVTFLSPENVKEICKELKEQLDSLRAKKKDCDDEAEKEAMTMKTSYEYNDWDQRVTNIDFQVTESLLYYETEIPKIKKLTDVRQRISLGATMNNDIKKIKQLKKELTEMRNILVAKQADHVVKISNAPDITGFKTLENAMNTILSLLKLGKDVRGIQIHGILGTGKTTILQNLNNHGEVASMFQIVIWLKASSEKLDVIGNKKNFSIEELQRDVMHRLNLDDTIPVNQYKQKIWGKLKDKKYLLLLDNAKEDLCIDEIGFPNNWERGSKIVLTTRFKLVCPSIVDRSIKVGVLTSKEARRMFSNILNKDFSNNTIIMKLMRRVVDWFRGLPVAIKIVAGYFKLRDTESSWRTGLNTLNSWPEYGDDTIKDMCRTLSFCCDVLKGAEKDCFYYGALYPEESNIYKDRLLDCWMAEKFLGTKGRSGRAKGQYMLELLNNLNLFEEDERKKCVRMHKLIRLVALHNLQIDGKHKCLVLSNEESLDQENMDSWKEKHWISLAENKSLNISLNSPDCSVLSTLFLQGNLNLKKFPTAFFKRMGSLRVLDLMGTSIESLPDCLMNAKNLEVLYLNGCTNLLGLPSDIGKLELLEVLDISGSGVDIVPPQIQSLKHLKRFLVSSSAFSETNIFNVISDLTELQEMLIDTKSEKEIYDWGIIDAVMESVKSLRHMTSLQFRFLHDEVVDVIEVVDGVTRIYAHKEDNIKFFVEKEEGLDSGSFQVFIGCPISSDVKIPKCERFHRYVKYCNGRDRSPAVFKLLSKADSLVIRNHYDLEHLSEFEFSNSSAIKGCLLEHCNKIKYIAGHYSVLSKLERLYLNDLLELESLWGGSINLENLPKLKTLKLSRCPKLIKIITQEAVKDIIQISHGAGQKPLVFPNLKEVILVEMQNLTSIWENELLEWPALKRVEISKCPTLHHLPFSKDNAKKLTSILAEESWWEALQWRELEAKQHFQKYCTFVSNR